MYNAEGNVRRALPALLAGLVFLGLVALSTAGANGAPAPERAIALGSLSDCPKHVRPKQMRCGHLRVPLERANPSLGSIRIAFAVRPRDVRKKPSKGTIVAIEGGPGYGSIDGAFYYGKLFGSYLRRRELLLVDTRGTGYSEAIDCPALQKAKGTTRQGLRACARQLGPSYGSYRTSAAADDLDAVREHLGLGALDVYGDSYGTYLAQSYAFRHGDRVESLVLDSAYPVFGESAWYPSIWRTGIKSLRIACDRSRRCPGDAGRRLDRFVALLRSRRGKQLELGGVGPLLDRIGTAGYGPPDSYLRIDRAVRLALAGRLHPYRKLTRPHGGGYGKPEAYSAGLELAVSCNDYPMLWNKANGRLADRKADREAAIAAYPRDRFLPFTPREIALKQYVLYNECISWPKPSPYYEFPAEGGTATSAPTLVVSGELDDVTSPREGRLTAGLFENSRFFLARNSGHVASLYDFDSPPARRIRSFLRRYG